MAKKRTIDLENAEPLRDLPSSGVQVSYKHQTIIASDDTSEYALLTRGKICEANIGVVYVKPEPAPVGALINFTDTAETYHDIAPSAKNYIIGDGGAGYVSADLASGNRIIPRYIDSEYVITLNIGCSIDALDVTLNGNAVPFNAERERYACESSTQSYPTSFNITIADKSRAH